MKKYLVLFLLILTSCGGNSEKKGCWDDSAKIPASKIYSITEWEQYFEVDFDEIKKNFEGLYQSDNSEYQFEFKIDNTRDINYTMNDGYTDCAEILRIPVSCKNLKTDETIIDYVIVPDNNRFIFKCYKYPCFDNSLQYCETENSCIDIKKVE